MNSDIYTIFALLMRYVLTALVFLAIIQAIKESRKDNLYRGFVQVATLSIIDTKEQYALEQDNIIGKANKNDIIIKDRSVRRSHARLYMESDEWIIEPYRGSKVYVNLYEVEDKHIVEDNDEIIFGDMVCIFNQIDPMLEESFDEEN